MTYQVAIMFAVAGILATLGIACLVRLASPKVTEGQTYAFRMIGIMLVSGAVVLAMSAGAMHGWNASP